MAWGASSLRYARVNRADGSFGGRRGHPLHSPHEMSELNEARWSVLSERGCEASRLSYPAAVQLVAQLRRASVFGLSIITDEAAARLNHKQPASKPPAKKRASRRKLAQA